MTIKLDYLNSGVNVKLANKLAGFLKKSTVSENSRVISGIGGFASVYDVSNLGKHPCIVSCTDGVGTKLKDRKSTRLNSSHIPLSRMPSSA